MAIRISLGEIGLVEWWPRMAPPHNKWAHVECGVGRAVLRWRRVLGGWSLLWSVAKGGKQVNDEGNRLVMAFGGRNGVEAVGYFEK